MRRAAALLLLPLLQACSPAAPPRAPAPPPDPEPPARFTFTFQYEPALVVKVQRNGLPYQGPVRISDRPREATQPRSWKVEDDGSVSVASRELFPVGAEVVGGSLDLPDVVFHQLGGVPSLWVQVGDDGMEGQYSIPPAPFQCGAAIGSLVQVHPCYRALPPALPPEECDAPGISAWLTLYDEKERQADRCPRVP